MLFIIFMAVLAIVLVGGLASVIAGHKEGLLIAMIAVLVGIATYGLNSVTTIESGFFAVPSVLGTVQQTYYPGNGIQWVRPLSSLTKISAKRTSFEIDGSAISADGNPLSVDINFAYSPNPTLAWKLLVKIGTDYENQLVKRAAAQAVRDGINQHTWLEANGMNPLDDADGSPTAKVSVNANADGRRRVEKSIADAWRRTLVAQLVESGFTPAEAEIAFSLSDVQLVHANPEQKILDTVASKVAASQEFMRQRIITRTAGEIATRRTQEGDGYANLLRALPLGKEPVTASQFSEMLHGIADKERADAILIGVENGKFGTLILSAVPVTTTTAK